MTNQEMIEAAKSFDLRLDGLKKKLADSLGGLHNWYPYGSMSNIEHIETMLGDQINLHEIMGKRVVDIGGSDGDMAFFAETLGAQTDLVDNPDLQRTGLKGARLLKEALRSKVNILEADIDKDFEFKAQYDLAFFLGILYHLQNPLNAMRQLSKYTKYCILSTRIAAWAPHFHAPDKRTFIGNLPVAYLVAPHECNNDSTNYWIFSEPGLVRLLKRSGWEILLSKRFGDTENSNPKDSDHDERYFCLLKTRI